MIDFKPGIYRHWKGPLYRALFLAQDSTNRMPPEVPHGPLVVYVSLEGEHAGNICVRSLEQWNELMPAIDNGVTRSTTKVPRFKYLRP